jgi:hypothetical protein
MHARTFSPRPMRPFLAALLLWAGLLAAPALADEADALDALSDPDADQADALEALSDPDAAEATGALDALSDPEADAAVAGTGGLSSDAPVAAAPPVARPKTSGPRFRRAEGFILRLEGGYAYWRLDGDRIARQVGIRGPEVGPLLVNQTHDAPAAVLQIGFNILGHAAIALDVTATGWDVMTRDRGGAGFAAGTVAWHPVELLAELLPIGFIRDRFWDLSVFAGGGYGVLGQDRAMDGMHLVFGARAEFFPARWISLGATLRHYPLRFDRYVVHWDNGIDEDLPERSGGSVLIPTFTVALRVPTGG